MTRNPKDNDRHAHSSGDESNLPARTGDDAAESGAARRAESQSEKLSSHRSYDAEVEAFVPTDFYATSNVRGKRHRVSRKKRRALWAVLVVLGVLLLCVGGAAAYVLFLNPSAQFAQGNPTPDTVVVETIDNPDATPSPAPTPTPTVDPYEVISAQADTSMMQNIVNVLLIGVDYAEERETWGGKHDYHADVMMVAAINFDENRVDLISLPRDTYAKIPGVKGIYKLNAALNCGGGLDAEGGAGFLKCCEAASWMLCGDSGKIPVNYYYAVTMPAVKQLVDTVGGVDYNLELSFSMAGRSYDAGPQHMNGQAVLDYLRVRKNVDKGGDNNRVNRQKMMLVALFESMQQQNLILKIPEIVSSFKGQLFTNCTFGQTAALTKFAYTLDGEDIGMYSMGSNGGSGGVTNIFNWNFCLTDQSHRVDVVEQVYGVTVSKELEYTADYAEYRWADMIASQYLKTVAPLTDFVSEALAADDLLPTMEPTPEITPEALPPDPTPDPAVTGGVAYNGGGLSSGTVRLSARRPDTLLGEEYQQYSLYQRDLFNSYLMSLDDLEEAQAIARKEASKYAAGKKNDLDSARQDVSDYASHVKTNALELAAEFGYPTNKFVWTYWYDKDSDFNEVDVDFR